AAPKGRLIMPQVQVTRDLLDNGCIIISVTTDKLSDALSKLKNPPDLVITDSQVFGQVNSILPKEIRLTSYSMLMAKNKGDIDEFVKGAFAIRNLKDGDKVLIIENCAHHVMKDDIARIKIPMMLKKFTGKEFEIVNISGQNAYPDLSDVSLVIHCGGCMINRKTMLSKQKYFKENDIPMTNFGVALALMNGILERVVY
ncbi:MAG: [Oscillospiraceae bacterium]|nr:[FeFe] hydrogenase H-cluster maturation GTPase HydF [Oscillospiraceae bacterium]